MQKIMAIIVQFLKATKKIWKLTWKSEGPLTTHRKMATLLIFTNNCQKLILFCKSFSTSYILAICFSQCASYTKKTTEQWQKSRLNKYFIYDKHTFLSFRYFHFCKTDIFCQKDRLLSSLLCCKFWMFEYLPKSAKKTRFVVCYFEIFYLFNF